MSASRVASRQQGGLEIVRIEAVDLAAAHAALGEQLRGAIAAVVERRLASVAEGELAAQLHTVRASRAHLARKAAGSALSPAIRRALQGYLGALEAWSQGADLAALSPLTERHGAAFCAQELALWLQDDNTGCQTGVLRAEDGAVLLWHTEEDTIGLFDRARLVEMRVAGTELCAFLYPYLMPGPAFGWHARGVLAYDTLTLRRSSPGGTPTSALSWLLWSTQGELPALETARALAPFLDGGAFTLVQRAGETVTAEVLEVGGELAILSTLPDRVGARRLQVNKVSEHARELASLELLDEADSIPYRERLLRTERLLEASAPDEAGLRAMLASRDGAEWAFANQDVVAHLIARVGSEQIALRVGVGAASLQGEFAASYVVR